MRQVYWLVCIVAAVRCWHACIGANRSQKQTGTPNQRNGVQVQRADYTDKATALKPFKKLIRAAMAAELLVTWPVATAAVVNGTYVKAASHSRQTAHSGCLCICIWQQATGEHVHRPAMNVQSRILA